MTLASRKTGSGISATAGFRRHLSSQVPFEGSDGLFTRSWYPICLSSAATDRHVRGFDFLDGRVIVFRNQNGAAQVMSAYCPHMGADLSIGDVVDGRIRCVFHHWQYGNDGRCERMANGKKAPATARLFVYPSQERFGIIWAYNGIDPHYNLPDMPFPDDELVFKIRPFGQTLPVDPWIVCANTPDMQHIKYLHGIEIDGDDPHEQVEWSDHSMLYSFSGIHTTGDPVKNRVGIYGTSLYYQHTDFAGRWFGFMAAFGLPRPATTITYLIVAARRDMGTPEEIDKFLDWVLDMETQVVSEDILNMETIHFRPGTLTREDKSLARFFDYVRAFPRAHPGADFIS